MDMRRISCQQYAPDAVPIYHSHCRPVDRAPFNALNAITRDLVHHTLDARLRGLCFRGELKQRRVWQRAKPDHAAFSKGPEMPIAAIQPFDFDVRYEHGLLVDRFAFEPQPEG